MTSAYDQYVDALSTWAGLDETLRRGTANITEAARRDRAAAQTRGEQAVMRIERLERNLQRRIAEVRDAIGAADAGALLADISKAVAAAPGEASEQRLHALFAELRDAANVVTAAARSAADSPAPPRAVAATSTDGSARRTVLVLVTVIVAMAILGVTVGMLVGR